MTKELADSIKQIMAVTKPDSILANTINQLVELVAEMRVRLVQIASGDYKACGVFAEDVARDALTKADALLEGLKHD
jgi:hypothetical protein